MSSLAKYPVLMQPNKQERAEMAVALLTQIRLKDPALWAKILQFTEEWNGSGNDGKNTGRPESTRNSGQSPQK